MIKTATLLFSLALALGFYGQSDAQAADVYGAKSIDTSAFALGRARLNVIFLESDGSIDVNQETWSPSQLNAVRGEVAEATTFWEGLTANYHPNARLQFDVNYVNDGVPLATGYEPIRRASTQDSFWISDVMGDLGYGGGSHFDNVREFDNDQRLAGDTHWATTLFVVNDAVDADKRFSNGQFAYGYIGGPYMVLTYSNYNWGIDRFNRVLSHELAHSFFALDEYADAGNRNNERSGYLNGVNGNAQLNAQGQSVSPPQPNALMLNNTLDPSNFTDVQVGHRDTDGDSIPDILDTFPLLTGGQFGSDPLSGLFGFVGSTMVTTLPNLNTNQLGFSSSGAEMTINWIAAAQYRIDDGAWIDFAAADGAYDDHIEPLMFTIASLAAGDYLIDVRSLNSVDNPSVPLRFAFHSQAVPVPEPGSAVLAWTAVLTAVFPLSRFVRDRHGR
ncbi:MAG: hypothetical protein WD875_16545 [Pirellulales bacterium]